MNDSEPPKQKRRWYHLAPWDCFAIGLLAVEASLLLTEWSRLSPHPKGWLGLHAVACVGVALLGMLIWFAAGLLLRRPFQFALRPLLVPVVAVAIPCTWLAVEVRRADKQQEAVEAIEEVGGKVACDFQRGQNGEPPGPAWLRNMLPDHFFTIVIGVSHGEATNADLMHLESLMQLQWLSLSGPQVTDAGLVHVKGLTRLQELFLGGTQVSDAGMENLTGLTQLETLNLVGTQVTDAGLRDMKQLPQLFGLELTGTPVTGPGLEHLKGLTSLQVLSLESSKITDAGLVHLKGLTSLRSLSLQNSKITDAGLDHLKGLTSLSELELFGTQVTGAGVTELQKALPNCRVSP